MQSAQLSHLFHLAHVLEEGIHGFLVNANVISGQLLQRQAALVVGHVVGIVPGPVQNTVDVPQDFFIQIAAQFDVHAAACHIGSNCHRAKSAGLGNNARFLIVFARVQHLVRNAALQGLHQPVAVRGGQVEDAQQAVDIRRFLRVEGHGQVQAAGQLAQLAGFQFVDRRIQRLQLGDGPFGHLDVFHLGVQIADEQRLRQAANSFRAQAVRQPLRMFHGSSTNQLRAANYMELQHFLADGAQLGLFCAVNHVGVVLTPPEQRFLGGIIPPGVIGDFIALIVFCVHRGEARVRANSLELQVGRDGRHVQLIDLIEFFRLGERRTAHPTQLLVHAEVILDGDGCIGDVLRLDLHPFLGLYCLMQAI